jgi:hypothetical protein
MRFLKACLLAVGLLGSTVYAEVITVPCTEQPAPYYADKQCTAGDFIFKDISWTSLGPTPANPEYVQVPGSAVLLHPVFTGTTVGMLFFSDQFNIGPGQKLSATLSYFVDPDPPIFDDLSLEFFAQSPQGDAHVTLTMEFCAGARFPCNAESGGEQGEFSLTWLGGNPNPGQKTIQLARGVNVIDVIMTLEMDGGTEAGNGSAQIDGARASSAVVPEPASVALTVFGGLALLLARKRFGRS